MANPDLLEFLELPHTATDAEIVKRALEKKSFFEQLEKAAPNAVLKRLHSSNLQKITDILNSLGVNPNEKRGYVAPPETARENTNNFKQNHDAGSREVIGWLIRHTEHMDTKSFPLYEGKNALGRETHQVLQSVKISDDIYISRHHALITVSLNPSAQIYITDGIDNPSKNGTYINGSESAISSRVKLAAGDTIQVGLTKLILKINEGISLNNLEKNVEESEYTPTIIINM